MAETKIGIDLGGTKIEAIAMTAQGTVLDRRRVATPTAGATATIAAIHDLVAAIEAKIGADPRQPRPIGIGTPGSLSPHTGLMRNSNSVCLNGLALDRMLSDALHRPVRLANDANCFALSEATDGAAAGAESVFGVILGTGVGGGISIGGRLLNGHGGIAGEWGHNPLPYPADDERPGPRCYCGRDGCIETFLSGPALAADYARDTNIPKTEPAKIFAAAEAGDSAAAATVRRYTDRLARALATVINLLDPEVIVLGGGVSKAEVIYREVPKIWHRWIFADKVTTKLVPPRHGDSSGVRGAAWLWDQ